MLTRGYRVVRPPWGRRPRRHSAAKSLERRRPRSMPWWYRCPRAYVGATHPAKLSAPPSSRSMSLWYRCPRAYVGAAHSAKLPAPQGSHYSIAAGERSEPAEGGPHHHRPQGGRTLVVCGCPAPASFRVAALHRLLPWLAVQSVCPFDPLGAVHIYVWLSFRGFAMLTRGYRVVRPPWGRLPRRHSAAKSRERRRPRRHPRCMPWWYRRPHATSV